MGNQENLLKICLPHGWECFSSKSQKDALNKAIDTFKATGGKAATAGGLIVRLISAPVGGALLAKGITDPAYRVTIPCVFHIAYLRWKVRSKYLEELNKENTVNATNQLVVKYNSQLIFGEEVDKPALTFSSAEISKTAVVNWESNKTEISSFNQLLQTVPSLITSIDVANTQYVEINIPLESLTPVKNSTDQFRAWTSGANGRITEHGKLASPENLKKIVNLGALFQIASTIVAQKHLADINKKLNDIKKSIDDIYDHLQNEREANISSVISYFQQIAPAILSGELRDSYQHQIEACENKLLSTLNHLIKDIEIQNNNIKNIKNDDTFGSEGMKIAIENHQKKIFNFYQQLFLCIRARACGWQLLLEFPNIEAIAKTRKQHIDESLARLDFNVNPVKQTILEMDKKIRDLSAKTNKQQTLNQRKLELLTWQDDLISEVTKNKIEIKQGMMQGQKFLLKIENNEVIAFNSL